MMKQASRAWLTIVTVLLATACGERAEPMDMSPVTLRLVGDSLHQMVERSAGTIECQTPFRAEVEGPEGAHAVMRGGTVQYWWWTTQASAGAHELDQRDAHQLWVDSIFPVGQDRLSHPFAFGQAAPAEPLRGEVVFRYSASNDDEVRQTEPFRFYCY